MAFAFNVFNAETTLGVIEAALKHNQPIYLQTSASTVRFYSARRLYGLIDALIPVEKRKYFILHLDHCDDMTMIDQCIEAGWDSVMIDASAYPLHENIERTLRVVNRAREQDVLVEGEIGTLAGEGEDGFGEGRPDIHELTAIECQLFIESTGVDLAAIAVGNRHGYYPEGACQIDVDLLAEVHQLCPDSALVLHGGSGIPHDQVAEAVRVGGVRKINISTDVKDAYLNGMQKHLSGDGQERHDMTACVGTTVSAVKELAGERLSLLKRISQS